MNERLLDYLLDELAPDERTAFEADPARVAEAQRLRPVVTRLESLDREEWNPPDAPPLALPRAPEVRPDPRPAPRRRRVLTLRPLIAAGLALVLLAIGVGAGRLLDGRDGGGGNDGGRVLALDPVEPAGRSAHGTATILADGGRARFTVRGLKPSANGDFYELWLMNSADDLVSLGSFRVPASGETEVTVPLPADPDGFAALDISAEPADGNPAHSARSVLRAPLKPS
jgi:anti-sigma-K factor RskA